MAASTLSLCMMARKSAGRVIAVLTLLRPLVGEIVLAVDRTGDPETLEASAALADRRFVVEPAPLNQRLAWLLGNCRGDWILWLEDDEVPGRAFLDGLGPLLEERFPTQVAFSRRWLFPDGRSYISSLPWGQDYQVRLVRNVPGIWRFPGLLHQPIEVVGERRLVDLPLYHCDLVLATLDERRAKRDRYDFVRPGLLTDGFPVNQYYTPEDCPGVETLPVSLEDAALIEQVARARPRAATGSARSPVEPGPTPAEAGRLNGSRQLSPGAYRARVELVRAPARLTPGEVTHHEVVIENLGDEWWPCGEPAAPPLRLGYRWLDAEDPESVVLEGRTAFPETVPPGGTTRMFAGIEAPGVEGTLLLELDVVHEHVRWFGCGVRTPVVLGPTVAQELVSVDR
jgi:hypothetical protein